MGVAEHVYLAGVLAGVAADNVEDDQVELVHQPELAGLDNQEASGRDNAVPLPPQNHKVLKTLDLI